MPDTSNLARAADRAVSGQVAPTRWYWPYQYGPWRSDFCLELSVAVLFMLALVAPRGTLAYLAILLGVCLAVAYVRRRGEGGQADLCRTGRRCDGLWISRVGWGLAATFILFAFASSTWSVAPQFALRTAAEVSVLLAILWLLTRLFLGFDGPTCRFVMRGLVHGGIAGIIYIAIEHSTDGALKAWAINTTSLFPVNASFNIVRDGIVVAVDRTFLNRHSAALAVLVWPILVATELWLSDMRWRRVALQIVLVTAAAVLLAISNSETAKLAFIVGGSTYLLARFRAGLTAAGLAFILIIAALATPLLIMSVALPAERVVAPYNVTAAARLEIWHHTITRARDAPIVGHGAAMTETLGDLETNTRGWRRLDNHAHNAFVQIWFELGAVGAVILCLLGGVVVYATTGTVTGLQPWLLAQVAGVSSVAATGYGFWQMWLLALYALAAVCMVVAAHFVSDSRAVRSKPHD